MEITLLAPAKINLTLEIKGRRPDGYHEVAMVMQSLELADTITCRLRSDGKIFLEGNHPEVAWNETNLAWRAAWLLQEVSGVKLGAEILVEKRIPVAAGLAGGSTDAAGVLRALNQLWNLNWSREKLAELGARLGSDVPFCLYGGTALATGRGEQIQPLPALPQHSLLLLKPPYGVSTAEIYGLYARMGRSQQGQTERMLAAVRTGNWQEVARHLANDLEQITLALAPDLKELKEAACRAGCPGVLMSGSGPTLFALINDEAQDQELAQRWQEAGQVIRTKTGLPLPLPGEEQM
ncbi:MULTISPECIES: 4-(cytidine 5'-diphospho)-2-C-methyl-D-erythritol kinase [Carboxydocella]|uniref:4-diphosphocytidyl-2-C-methyl-D-erythritol kinase n=2 Tax=Carboxydocella TaxID=178898 RepID=A0A1T4QJC0_9FIRM|nr:MULTISPECIES: 4-(cytidine 5'-diphospho)-2-C-methyl-D-erythritol kinase [Carboxydocella]AVX19261.1 4-diphosphocytidyl-2-C-methyl-D-erythritol kinase [Carboxydocella thermautotrophica]AVX29674.1 4-diphosphocytidyl-2-C-methyl-D-erythritol kinase [Carboxydocella thermautotrophica]SKA03737.1 4-diphosphocytidyl-2-C-methyl-D-erythritol kinase [Carboxydocella sporoproducens DSM 16521]GAW29862.1 4-(cytidine 5'-diphospho)-2-C-methyl-D-erythritol kinase [Carboxydocella sp. ULO1]GAW32881.1 4-(cytidine 